MIVLVIIHHVYEHKCIVAGMTAGFMAMIINLTAVISLLINLIPSVGGLEKMLLVILNRHKRIIVLFLFRYFLDELVGNSDLYSTRAIVLATKSEVPED